MKNVLRGMLSAAFLTAMSVTFLFAQDGAYYTGEYRNLFKDLLGKTDAEIDAKVTDAFNHIFYGGSNEKLYYEVGTDEAYILDVNNNDVRTEGMSYGMMICVQLDKKEEFDKIWKWAKTKMQYGPNEDYDGYFSWQHNTDGSRKGQGPASDGEAYFVTALFFAANQWGNGEGIYNYEAEAQDILQRVMDKNGQGGVYPLFNTDSKQITFVPYYDSYSFTDPSYHLPAFWELWAMWSESNQSFWAQTPQVSRDFLVDASHPTSGLTTDYSNFDGTPKTTDYNSDSHRFMYDAWRTAMNIGMDAHWFGADSRQEEIITRLFTFFNKQGANYMNHYNWDGSNASGDHGIGLISCNAAACLALSDDALAKPFVEEFWNASPPTGTYRYYDGMLYMLALLHCSDNFRIIMPGGNNLSISLTSPSFSDNYYKGDDVTISASASVTEGTVSKVEFMVDGVVVNEDTEAPYSFVWTDVAAGVYEVTAKMTTAAGDTKTTPAFELKVAAPPMDGEITVVAMGETGTEIIELEVDGVVIDTWTLTTSNDSYVATANVNGQININYTNDDGETRDAYIDHIVVAGVTYEAEDQEINTGHYANNACGGAGFSETMHCSGTIQFVTNPAVDECPDSDKLTPGECGCDIPEGQCGQPENVVELTKGWNMVGCPILGSTAIESALSSIWDKVEVVKDFDQFYDATVTDFSLLKELQWGNGYMVKVSADCQLDWIPR